MYNFEKISLTQFFLIVFMLVVGDAILVLPAIPAFEAKQDAWIVAIVSYLAGFLIVLLYYQVGKIYPDLSIVQYNEKIFGKWLGRTFSVLFLFYLFLSAAVLLREIGDFLITQIMPQHPVEAVHILFLFTVFFAIQKGLEPIVRSAEIFFPWILLIFGLLVLLSLPDLNIENILPILENGWKPIMRGSIVTFSFPFVEMIVILMFFPYVKVKEKIKRQLFFGVALGGIFVMIICIFTVFVLGAEITARNVYPGYALAKKISIGKFFQRIEVIFAFMWFVTIFFKFSFYFYGFIIGLSQLFQTKEYKSYTFPLLILIYITTVNLSPDIVYFNNVLSKYWPFYDISIGLLLPIFIILIATVKSKYNKLTHKKD